MKSTPAEATVTFADIQAARERIRPYVHHTPVLRSHTLNTLFGADVAFKCENLQRIGAFKARGAHNAVFALTDAEAAHGVVTHSSGNHAAALALAARNRGVPAFIVMPSNAPVSKVASVKRNGGQITVCEPTNAAREATAARVCAETGGVLVHPYDNAMVIAGQGTCALEFLTEAPELDLLVAPVGGGGLLAGTAIAAKGVNSKISVYAAEPLGADDAARSFRDGVRHPQTDPRTIADGLRTALGEKNFPLIRNLVDDVVTVDEASIIAAMRLVWEVLKIIIEPSAAVPVAALLEKKIPVTGRRVGVILSGGNVDLDKLPWMNAKA
ncbi:pyridoxal-phosphate dependent enzyme [Oleiharenicola lentus]|uniref:pyridoxal-phosphate dependent enzyme n=1 Tax=Oleiharenicola lentus TaxID=2508720 RepID=UPI003F67A1B4